MELLQSNMAQIATYGLTLVYHSSYSCYYPTVTKSKYICKFCLVMHLIRKKYTYNHVHDATSLQTILTELASANRWGF